MRVHFKLLTLAIFSLSVNNVSCETRYCNDGLGICTAFTKCSNLTVFNSGDDHINVRFNVELEKNLCHYLEICCDPEDIITIELVSQHPPDNAADDSSENHDSSSCNISTHECIPFFFCGADNKDGKISRPITTPKCKIDSQLCCAKNDNIARFKPTVCGFRNKDGVGYSITNSDDETQYAEFPWMAAISEILPSGEGNYICGGSLINKKVVLTAAHCLKGIVLKTLRVRLGEWDTQTSNEIFLHSDHDVAQAIIHPQFNISSLFNDVALLVLKNEVELGAHINTICLPPQNSNFDKDTCFASGWGTDKFGHEDLYRVNLKKVELPVVSLKECQDRLRTTKLGPRFKIHNSFICAGGKRDIDTCTGDGGGPLVCPIPGKEEMYYQAGLVAWGIECGHENIPGVYANVAKFRTWIDQHMNILGYGTSSYTAE